MSNIDTDDLTKFINSHADWSDHEVEFPQIDVDLDGTERDIEIQVSVEGYTDDVCITHQIEGEEPLDVTINLAHLLGQVMQEDLTTEALGGLLQSLGHEECLQVAEAIAAARMILCYPDGPEKRKWERVHTAVTMMEPEPEPEPEPVEPDEKVIRTIEFEVPVTEEALAHAPTVESAPVPDTETVSSNVKETVKSILSVEDDRLMLIGLLVEAGYAVGKKVS